MASFESYFIPPAIQSMHCIQNLLWCNRDCCLTKDIERMLKRGKRKNPPILFIYMVTHSDKTCENRSYKQSLTLLPSILLGYSVLDFF